MAANFGAWGPLELKITLGELAHAAAVVGTGWWVAHIIERRQANQTAIKGLMVVLCREILDHLSSLSQIIEAECPAGQDVTTSSRNKIMRCLQRFSNSLHSIEMASQKADLAKVVSVEALKTHRNPCALRSVTH